MLLFFSLLATLAILVLILLRQSSKTFNYWKKRGVKHVKPVPLAGNMLPYIIKSKSLAEFIKSLYDAFPHERYIGVYQFTTPVLFIRDLELIKKVTIKNFEHFVDHTGFIPPEADPLWNKNLFSIRGEQWRSLRQVLSPAFTSSKMRSMFILMDECVKQLLNYYKDQKSNLIKIELKDVFTRYTNDVIASTAFGVECNSFKNQNNEFLLAGRELCNFDGLKRFNFLLFRQLPNLAKLLKVKIINDRLAKFFRNIIDETICLREEKQIVRHDLIHLLLLHKRRKLKYEEYMNLPKAGFAAAEELDIGKADQSSYYLSNEDITAQAIVFFFGGYDSAANLMCFAGYELALNPHIQRKLRNEITATNKKNITYEEISQLKYLDMVVSETLRKWPQGIFLDRKCTKTFEIEPETKSESKLKINVGDVCWIPVYAIHRDPKYYPNPEVFDPERFSDENVDKIQSGTFMPFGIGPRNCIDFELVPTEKTKVPIKQRADTIFVLPKGDFHVGLKRIQNY